MKKKNKKKKKTKPMKQTTENFEGVGINAHSNGHLILVGSI